MNFFFAIFSKSREKLLITVFNYKNEIKNFRRKRQGYFMDNNGKIETTSKEWEEAESFFKANPSEIKFRKSKTPNKKKQGHSFVKIDNVIYAMNNTARTSYQLGVAENDISFGGYGRVKFGVNQKNELIAIKVSDLTGEFTPDKKTFLQKKGYILGQEKRAVQKKSGETGRIILGENQLDTKAKVYTAMPYFEKEIGQDQVHIILVLGLSAMMEIEALHQDGYIHRDIKENNFLYNKKGEHFTVLPVDFDFLVKLPKGKKSLKAGYFKPLPHTPTYNAPEILKKREYSIATDTYALGHMLENLGFPEEIFKDMMDPDPKKRGNIRIAMEKAVKMIKEQYPEDHLDGSYPDTSISLVLQQYEDFCKKISSPPLKKDETPSTPVTMLHKKGSAPLKANPTEKVHMEIMSTLKEAQKALLQHSDNESALLFLIEGAKLSLEKVPDRKRMIEDITFFLKGMDAIEDKKLNTFEKNIKNKIQTELVFCIQKIEPGFQTLYSSSFKNKK